MGRKPRLTPEISKLICNQLRIGVPFGDACWLANIDPKLGGEWILRGKGEHDKPQTPLYAAFAGDVEKANAAFVSDAMARVTKEGMGGQAVATEVTEIVQPDGSVKKTTKTRLSRPNWFADAWRLERRRQDQFAIKNKTEITGKDGGPVETTATKVDIGAMTDEEFDAFADLIERAAERRRNSSRASAPKAHAGTGHVDRGTPE
jgi:hypothetical protein